jgi:drug/metabolite transporter (DMT)-like permease
VVSQGDQLPLMFTVFALIIAAAFLHATWNLFAKVSKDTIALMWWATLIGTLGYGLLLITGPGIYLDSRSWLPFLLSAAAETGYFVTLVQGYSQGDLSLVYPISRGSAPVIAVLLSAALLGERLPWFGYFGICLMVVGVYICSLPVDRLRNKLSVSTVVAPFRNIAGGWSLASALFIAIYSLSDKVAVTATPPIIYNWWVFFGNTFLWMPVVWRRLPFRGNFDELRNNWRSVLVTSAMMVGAYAAVLVALSLTSASYVVAGRGLSVVIGAIFGALLLKEGFGSVRILGAVLMVTGLILIAFA